MDDVLLSSVLGTFVCCDEPVVCQPAHEDGDTLLQAIEEALAAL
jgi:hypothetical protein